MWTKGNKKAYVSFDVVTGKANGIAWKGFGGR
jgi:hypothetical protein